MKIINSFFKRELIVSSDVEWVDTISDQLFKLIEKFSPNDMYNRKNRIITKEIIFDVLSRFSIVMDDDEVIKLCEEILEQRKVLDKHDSTKLSEFFGRIRLSINAYILSYFIQDLLVSDDIPLHFMFEFIDVVCQGKLTPIDVEI